MAEENTTKESGEQPAAGSKDTGIKRLHYIYHVKAENNQLLKLEEFDEDTRETREIPLPLYTNWVEAEEENAPAPEEGEEDNAGGDSPYAYPWYAPYGYYGYPAGPPWMVGMWWAMAPPPPPYPPYAAPPPSFGRFPPSRPSAARSFEETDFTNSAADPRKFNAEALRRKGPKPPSGKHPTQPGPTPSPKAGPLTFVGPTTKSGPLAFVGPTTKSGPLDFVGPTTKSGPANFVDPNEGAGPETDAEGSGNPDESSAGGPKSSPTGSK